CGSGAFGRPTHQRVQARRQNAWILAANRWRAAAALGHAGRRRGFCRRKDRLGWWRSVGWAEAAATRCQDGELIAGAHLEARGGAERLHRTVGAPDERLAALARLSPEEPEGGDAAVIREQRSRESSPELEPPHDAIAAAVPAGAARAAADRELAHQHRERALQDLRIGQPRVGHVGLYGVAAVEVRSRSRAARAGLVVLQPLVAEGQAVHGSMGGGENPER